jgi:hypothetical protein
MVLGRFENNLHHLMVFEGILFPRFCNLILEQVLIYLKGDDKLMAISLKNIFFSDYQASPFKKLGSQNWFWKLFLYTAFPHQNTSKIAQTSRNKRGAIFRIANNLFACAELISDYYET